MIAFLLFVGATVSSNGTFTVSSWEVAGVGTVVSNLAGSFFTAFMQFRPQFLLMAGVLAFVAILMWIFNHKK